MKGLMTQQVILTKQTKCYFVCVALFIYFFKIKLEVRVHLETYIKKIPVDCKHSTGSPGKCRWFKNIGWGITGVYGTIPREKNNKKSIYSANAYKNLL